MASIHTVLDAIIENGTSGNKVSLQLSDKREYETVRTRLVTLWQDHREVLLAVGDDSDPLVQCSLCGDFACETLTATFYLGKPRRKLAKSYSFSIVPPDDSSSSAISPLTEPANDESIVTPKLAE
jgi:hypothetical protein